MTVYGGPSISTDGLVFYIDPASPRSYPGSGTTLTDLTGNGNTQTLAAGTGPTYNSTNMGTLSYNGSTYVKGATSTSAAVNITNNITISAWVNQTSLVLYGGIAVFGTGSAEQYALNSDNTYGFSFTTNWPGTWYKTYSVGAANTGIWVNVVVTFASGTTTWYINGSLNNQVAQGISAFPSVATPYLGIGANFPGGVEYFNGVMGPIQIYNRVLSIVEVNQIFNAIRGRYGI